MSVQNPKETINYRSIFDFLVNNNAPDFSRFKYFYKTESQTAATDKKHESGVALSQFT